MPDQPTSTFHALLIGADFYYKNRLPDDSQYLSLNGCVRDIERVEAMLLRRASGQKPSITKLLAPNRGGAQPGGDGKDWPTAENIRKALRHLADSAKPGDQVYIHYSGHGGRVTTAFPKFKGSPVDEALVPIDIGGGPGTRSERYIRDVELAGFLDELAQKVEKVDPADPKKDRRVLVTLLLDSCHSGGMTRGTGIAKRSATGGRGGADGSLDTSPIPEDAGFDAATLAKLEASWQRMTSSIAGARSAAAVTTWLPNAQGFVLLAACRDTESAIEASLDGGPHGGVMTSAFLDALASFDREPSWRSIYDRVLARVTSRFPSQIPQLLGEGERRVFGVDLLPVPRSFPLLKVDAIHRRVQIGAGLAMTVEKGAQLGIYPKDTLDFSKVEACLATATVEEAGATDAWASIDEGQDASKIAGDAIATVLGLALRHKVELLPRGDLPQEVAAKQDAALAAVQSALAAGGNGFLELRKHGETPRYQVVVNEKGEYVICDPQGKALPYITSPLSADDPGAAKRVVERLLRLGRYHTVFDMATPSSQLEDDVVIELHRAPEGWKPGGSLAVNGTPLELTGDTYVVKTMTYLFLHVRNRRASAINVACLDLQCDWGIEVLVPDQKSKAPYEVVGAGEPRNFPIQVYVPDGFDSTPDVFKVFVTLGHAEFPWLKQTPIDEKFERADRSATRGTAQNGLARLFASLDVPENRTRHAAPVASADAEWMVRQLRVHVTRT